MEDPMVAPSLIASPTTVLTEICSPQVQMSESDQAATTKNTRISDAADFDNSELKVSIRLGGILPSDDEEEDVTNDQSFDGGPTSPLLRTPERAEEGPAITMTENNPLEASLRPQIDTLQRIASMESREYQQRLMENSIDTAALQDRSLVQLSQSLHRFHSVILNLNEENDSQTQEILRLQAQDMESQNKIARLEAAVSTLLAQKQKLRHKNRHEKSVNRRLVEHMQNVNNAQQQEEETIGRLLRHEQNLRERCDSSNFSSDLEGFETESVYSMASNRSMVTNEPPTVRIHRERNLTWPHSDFGGEAEKEEEGGDEGSAVEADHPSKPLRDRAKSGTATTKRNSSTTTTTTTTRGSNEPGRKVSEGGKSVSTADIWKASMRPSSGSGGGTERSNYWNTSSKDHDPLHKVNRSTILDLGEHDDVVGVRKKQDGKLQSEKQMTKKKIDLEPAFVHDFKVMFGKSSSPHKRKSSGEKFDLFDMFKKDDGKVKDKPNEKEADSSRISKRDSSATARSAEKHDHRTSGPSKPKKRESKTSIVLDNAKHEAQEAAEKFKSSMKNMGKMFDF